MASSPIYAATPQVGSALVNVSNPSRDGTGTIVSLRQAGPNGSIVTRLKAQAIAATNAGMIRFYLHDGSVARLFLEIPVATIVPSASVPAFVAEALITGGIAIPSTYSVRASTHNGEAFQCFAFLEDM